mmetsp:Transcript_10119/g.9822  ORF Transcript_10119/g.9822 Transcript_10119/m.9822 type:complete len:123 (+) Transcript_10119:196-564(+)
MTNISSVLKHYSNKLDARTICLCSSEGSELMTETRSSSGSEDVEIITSLVSNFSSSVEQATRLSLGSSKYSLTWSLSSIIIQAKIGAVVVSVILDENANLGLIDENMLELSNILKPYCLQIL